MRTLIQVVWHHLNRHGINHVQTVLTTHQLVLDQIVGKAGCAAFPADWLTGVVENLTVQHRFTADLDIVDV
ncbi:hypothetical protein SRABI106_03760 [Rahnella aquatilis]|nr:hypothetical protein SRABI106_03760 [Rahnella aquatilis]